MTNFAMMVELDKLEKEARKDYEQSGDSKFLHIIKKCTDERSKILRKRLKTVTESLSQIKL